MTRFIKFNRQLQRRAATEEVYPDTCQAGAEFGCVVKNYGKFQSDDIIDLPGFKNLGGLCYLITDLPALLD
jgi:hypothetical protein